MDIQLTEDQQVFLTSVRKVLERIGPEPLDGRRTLYSDKHDGLLEESGMMDAAAVEEYGPLAAVVLIEEVSRLPIIVETGTSSLVRPLLCPDWPRPIAVIAGDHRGMARFLPVAKSVLFLSGNEARIARIEPEEVQELTSFFAYPMGRLVDPDRCLARAKPLLDPSACARLHRVATAAEFAGALQGGLDSVVEHVKSRYQFGRPLGSFQAVQHRLAASAASIAAMRLMARKAAVLGSDEDALAALGFAQDAAVKILFDLHQFMGAMGLTLEHPLYRWSYRLKLLVSDLGGANTQFRALAHATWP